MALFETVLVSDLKKPVQVKQLSGNLFSGDNGGNKITVEVLDGGSAATLSGTVTGYILRADNATVTVTGTLSGNKASITLPASAYAVIGAVSIVVKLGTTTLGACTSYVYRTTTDTIVDPGSVVPDISELLAIIDDCEVATQAANTAATAAGYVNVSSSKSGKVITIVTTNKNNQSTSTTITEPTTTVSESSGTITVTCTDADGTTTVSFQKIEIDDTAGAGDTDKVWSADKTVKELQKKADLIEVTDETPEAVKTIQDGANGLPMELLIGIEPVQDLHGQEYPYPGGAGKNLLNESTSEDYPINEDGTIGTSTNFKHTALIPVTAGEDYTFSYILNTANQRHRIHEYDSNGDWLRQLTSSVPSTTGQKSITVTISNDASFIKISYRTDDTNLMVEHGSTASDYVPYSNVCPITGWTGMKLNRAGRNLIPTGTDTTKGYVNGKMLKNDGTTSTSQSWYISEYFTIKANETYTYALNDTGTTSIVTAICFYDINKQFISGERFGTSRSITFQTPANAYFARASVGKSIDTQLEPGTAISSFEAYKGTVYPITFPNEAGTVYGESLKINKDGTGELRNGRFAGTVQEIEAFTDTTPNVNAVGITVPEMISGSFNLIKGKVCFIAEKLKSSTYSAEYSAGFTNPYVCYAGSENMLVILVPASMTVAEFNAEFAGMKYVYVNPDKVTTETTYNLTAEEVGIITSLYGINNIWADTGDVLSITYPADTKLYVDNQIAEKISASQRLMELIVTANREDGMKATKAYSEGDLLIVSGTLYKASTSIANGATLTVDTNITATTVAAEIAALA